MLNRLMVRYEVNLLKIIISLILILSIFLIERVGRGARGGEYIIQKLIQI